MNVSIFSSMRAYESISLRVTTLVQIQTRLYGKVPVISTKMKEQRKVTILAQLFLLFRQNIVTHSTGKERNKTHRRFNIFDSNYY